MLPREAEYPGSDCSIMCLGMPIPKCVRDLIEETPHICMQPIDADILLRIEKFGRDHNIPKDEIDKACKLASGYSDVIILLCRPSDGHRYSENFKDSVRHCPTLDAVDKLIRYASRGQRTIQDVSVLDAYSFQPKKDRRDGLKKPWSELLRNILTVKKPKVLLRCWHDEAECPPELDVFRSQGIGTWPVRDTVEFDGQSVSTICSFHPATVVCYGQRKTNCFMLLICHFILAFRGLAGYNEVPKWIQDLCDRSREEGREEYSNSHSYSQHEIRTETIKLLEDMMDPDPMPAGDMTAVATNDGLLYTVRRYLGVETGRRHDFMQLAKLCMMWKHFAHPARCDVLAAFQKLASSQRWIDKPQKGPNYIGFADDQDPDCCLGPMAQLSIDVDKSEPDQLLLELERLTREAYPCLERTRELRYKTLKFSAHIMDCFKWGLTVSSPSDISYQTPGITSILQNLSQETRNASTIFDQVGLISKRLVASLDANQERLYALRTGTTTCNLSSICDVLSHTIVLLLGLFAQLDGLAALRICSEQCMLSEERRKELKCCQERVQDCNSIVLEIERLRNEPFFAH